MRRSLLVVVASTAGVLAMAAPPALGARGSVVRVVDGDSVRIRVAAGVRTFDLRGVDAPNSGQCFANAAKSRLRRLLPVGSRVTLEGSGRRVFVIRRGTFVNRSLVAGGYAEASGGGSGARIRSLRAAEARAEDAERGLWGACDGGSGPGPTSPPPPPPAPGGSQPGQTTRMSQAEWQAFLDNSFLSTFTSSNFGSGSSTRRDYTLCAGGAYAFRSETTSAQFNSVYTETGTWRILAIARRTDLVADEAKIEFVTQQSSGDVAPGTREEVFIYSFDDGRFRIGSTPAQKEPATGC